jgi:hypothetical protein
LIFGWQGFQFEHPDDWAPVNVSGSFDEGYVRLASPARAAIQVRWQRAKGDAGITAAISAYEARLRKDAAKGREAFSFQLNGREYRWSGAGQGRGLAMYCDDPSRTFLLEVIGGRGDQLLPLYSKLKRSFSGCTEVWSVLGLRVSLPAEFRLDKHEFQAGKTQLRLKKSGATLDCARWGFAEQLLAKHSLGEWAKAALAMPKAIVEEEGAGVRLCGGDFVSKKEALVRVQPDQNQIVTVKATYRRQSEGPRWDWLV